MDKIVIPEIAKGNEEIYKRFVMGKLIYKPDPNSDIGKIELPIKDLKNPLSGTFDLINCGESSENLSISTGYRKNKKVENADRVEVWFTPRFLIEKKINSETMHFQQIMDEWVPEDAPVGIFWNWGNWENVNLYDYLVDNTEEQLSSNNLYRKWGKALERTEGWHLAKNHPRQPERMRQMGCFIFEIG